MSVRF